jgi:hypothetical protein
VMIYLATCIVFLLKSLSSFLAAEATTGQ